MDEIRQMLYESRRRDFLKGSVLGLGGLALNTLLGCGSKSEASSQMITAEDINRPLVNPHFAPKARKVIFLFQSGGPSQMELFDYKPKLYEMHGQEIPASVIGKNRIFKSSNIYSYKNN